MAATPAAGGILDPIMAAVITAGLVRVVMAATPAAEMAVAEMVAVAIDD